jgi:D-alanyl-D-alanine carboxypeptidase
MRNNNLSKLFILLFAFFACEFQSNAQSAADSLLNFIVKNEKKSSLYLSVNDSTIAKLNEDEPMPLAQTVNIMIAIEFAKQAGAGVIDEDEYIPLSELGKYYIPGTDGDTEPAWINYERGQQQIQNDSVQLIEVARGMIMFDCDANAEYLLDLLGLDNVKNNAPLFGLKYHTAVFPIVASLFMYQNPKKDNTAEILKSIRHLSEEQYCKAIYGIHEALKNDTLLKPKYNPQDFSIKMQRLWSDRLTSSTTKEYVAICKTLNRRRLFSDLSYGIIAEILEYAMENPSNMNLYRHMGMKGGSTPWVLTKAIYATTADGTRIEMAYFFNDISPDENAQLKTWMNDFELKALTDEQFREKIASALK